MGVGVMGSVSELEVDELLAAKGAPDQERVKHRHRDGDVDPVSRWQ